MTGCFAINWLAVEAIGNWLVALVAGFAMYAAYWQMRAQLRHQSELEMKRLEQHYLDRLLDVIDVVTHASMDFVSAVSLAKLRGASTAEIFGYADLLRHAIRQLGAAASARNIIGASRSRRLAGRRDIAFKEFGNVLDDAMAKNANLMTAMTVKVMDATTENLAKEITKPSVANIRLRAAAAALLANMFSPDADEAASLGELPVMVSESQPH